MFDDSPFSQQRWYDDARGTYHVRHDWGAPTSMSSVILDVCRSLPETEPLEEDTLYERIDPDALDMLFTPLTDSTTGTECGVWFRFNGYTIIVYGDGEIAFHRHRDAETFPTNRGP